MSSLLFLILSTGIAPADQMLIAVILLPTQGQYIKSKNYILGWLITNGVFQLYIFIVTVYICGYLQYYRLYVSMRQSQTFRYSYSMRYSISLPLPAGYLLHEQANRRRGLVRHHRHVHHVLGYHLCHIVLSATRGDRVWTAEENQTSSLEL